MTNKNASEVLHRFYKCRTEGDYVCGMQLTNSYYNNIHGNAPISEILALPERDVK